MRVDDPHQTIDTVCSLSGSSIDYSSFKAAYERRVRGGKEISRSHAEAHFFFLTVLGILKETGQVGKYKMSEDGNMLCDAMATHDDRTYQRILAGLLLASREKGKYFRDFLEFLRKARSPSEVSRKYRRAGSSLLEWCKDAGLIEKRDEYYIVRADHINDINDFWHELKSAYLKEISSAKTRSLGSFVKIDELRRWLLPKLSRNEDFDKYLEEVLANQGYSSKVELSGAPPAFAAQELLSAFVHRKRKYYFIALVRG
jgi:hypothetical protein